MPRNLVFKVLFQNSEVQAASMGQTKKMCNFYFQTKGIERKVTFKPCANGGYKFAILHPSFSLSLKYLCLGLVRRSTDSLLTYLQACTLANLHILIRLFST